MRDRFFFFLFQIDETGGFTLTLMHSILVPKTFNIEHRIHYSETEYTEYIMAAKHDHSMADNSSQFIQNLQVICCLWGATIQAPPE